MPELLTPEILPATSLRVIACPHPFSINRVDLVVPAGQSVAEILKAAGCKPGCHARVFVDDQLIPRDWYARCRPKAGHTVTVRVIPTGGGGGGKNPLRIVLMIAVVALAIAFPYLAPAWMGLTATVAGVTTVTLTGALVGAGIGIVGSLLVNAIAPPPRPDLGGFGGFGAQESPALSIAGARNAANRYGPIPRVCGRVRMFPNYGAEPYTEIVGNDQYLRLLFCPGFGPLELSDFKIGNTPLANFTGVELEIRQGFADDPPLTLVTNDVHEDALPIALTAAAGEVVRLSAAGADELSVDVTAAAMAVIDGAGNPQTRTVDFQVRYRLVGAGGWTTLGAAPSTAATLTSALTGANNDLLFTANALGAAGNNISIEYLDPGDVLGDIPTETVIVSTGPTGLLTAILVQLRRVSSVLSTATQVKTAIQADATANALVAIANAPGNNGTGVVTSMPPTLLAGGVTSPPSLSITDKKLSLVRRGLKWPVSPSGTYEVGLTRTTPDTTDPTIRDLTFWTALRTIRKTAPLTKSGLAKIALRIKATDQLNGIVDSFNCIAGAINPDWNGVSWVSRVTSNPAALYRDGLQGPSLANPLQDARLDLTALQDWAEDCTARGLSYDGLIDFSTTIFEHLKDVAAMGRASFGFRDGLFSVVRDLPQTVPKLYFSPRNSWGYTWRKAFPDAVHALKVRWRNPDADWQIDERIVPDDGYGVTGADGIRRDAFGAPTANPEATQFNVLDLPRQINPAGAFKHARFHLAQFRLRPDEHVIFMDPESLVATRGDMARGHHDVIESGIAAGRIKAVQVDGGGNATGITLDDIFPMEAGKTYAARIRKSDGTDLLKTLVTVAGEQTTVTFTVAEPAATKPAVGDLALFGLLGSETGTYILQKIRPGPDLSFELTLQDLAPAIHTADTGSIPPFDSHITKAPVFQRTPALPIIDSVVSDESVLVRGTDGAFESRIVIFFHFASGAPIPASHVQVRFRPTGSTSEYAQVTVPVGGDAVHASVGPVEDGLAYDLLVRSISAFGLASDWVTINNHTVIGKTTLPPAVTGLVREGRLLRWVYSSAPLDFAGFRVREIAGLVPIFSAGVPSHDGLLTDPNFRVLLRDGIWTFMVVAEDVAGNQSAVVGITHDFGALSMETEFGDAIPTNLILSTDLKAAGFPGAIVNGTVTAGNLVANGDGTKFWVADDNQLFWKADASTFWPVSNYLEMAYTATLTPDLDKLDALLSFPVTVSGQGWHVDYRPDSQALFWPARTLFWDADTATFWPAAGDFILWPGVLADLRRQAYELRVTVDAGPAQGVISACEADWDVRDIEEELNDVVIAAAGTRLPITKAYRAITNVHLTLEDDGGVAERVKTMDKLTTGPLVKAWDGADVLTTALVDARVKGY